MEGLSPRKHSTLLFCYVGVVTVVMAIGGDTTDVQELRKLSSCSCETPQGVVDLSPLANTDGSARFKDVRSSRLIQFSWNPCYSFTEAGCENVAGCQILTFQRAYYNLGTQDSVRFQLSPEGLVQFVYESPAGTSSEKRTLYVTLKCQEKDADMLEATGERALQPGTYDLFLSSKHACPRWKPTPAMLSAGSIILMTLAFLILVYIAAGALYQSVIEKASGMQIIPNFAFWTTLFGLIKDGCQFTVTRGKSSSVYQEIS